MKKVADLVNAFAAFKQANPDFSEFKICNNRISNLKNYISQHCSGNLNYRIVILNQLDPTMAAIPDWMLLTEFFQVNWKMYADSEKNSGSSASYNLDKNLTIRRPTITFESLVQCHSPCLSGQFHDTIFVGKRNAFLGVILYNGVVLLYRETLLKLLDYEKEFFDILTLIINKVQFVTSTLYDNMVSGVGEFVKTLSVTNLYSEYRLSIINTLASECPTLDSDAVRQLFDKFEDKIFKYYIEPLTKSNIFGASNIYSYANLLKQMRVSYEDKIADATRSGYEAGLARSSVFLTRNYKPSAVNGGIHWSKDITIYPEVAIIRGASFKIPEKGFDGTPRNLIYFIKQLTFHPDGTVSATGRHPNVSGGGGVCLGDLVEKSRRFRTMSNEDLGDYIDRVETLLENVNFDSAYFPFDKDFKAEQFVERAQGLSRYAMHKKMIKAEIRDAIFTVDDGIDEDDEPESDDETSDESVSDVDINLVEARFESSRLNVSNMDEIRRADTNATSN